MNTEFKAKYHGGKRSLSNIKYIVIHYVGNPGSTARGNARYFSDPSVEVSAHYVIDNNEIYQCLTNDYVAWAVGGSRYADYKQTGGARLFGVCTNYNSISIELCHTETKIEGHTLSKAAQLCAELLKTYNLGIDALARHFDVTGKTCPGVPGWYGKNSMEWEAFKVQVALLLTPSSAAAHEFANDEVNAFYRVRTAAGWLPEVRNLTDYAGLHNVPISGLAIRVDRGTVAYRVHTIGGKWLPWVTGCNIYEPKNGYAGDGHTIDAVQVYYYTPRDIIDRSGYQQAWYRSSVVNDVSYFPWQKDTEQNDEMDGYAGVFGKKLDLFQLYIGVE